MRLSRFQPSREPIAIPGVVIALAVGVIVLTVAVGKLAAAGVRYFPPSFSEPSRVCDYGAGGRRLPIVNDLETDWFSSQWRAAEEPSLYLASLQSAKALTTTYRFTWLRTFHRPMMIRVDVLDGGRMRLTAKQLSGAGGYDPGQIEKRLVRTLTQDEQAKLQAALATTEVLSQPSNECKLGFDGSQWIVEANEGGHYVFVNRWTPSEGPVHAFGMLMLSFTGWPLDPVY